MLLPQAAQGGWPKQFLDAGASGFIGCLWNITDTSATAFAIAFYNRLIAGIPIGEAVRQARLEIRKQAPGDPSWVAYTVFANPLASCEVGITEEETPSPTEGLRELPEGPFERDGIRLAHRFREAIAVSGDFYNVIPWEDGGVGLYLVDVAGHGLPAARQAMTVKQVLSRAGEEWGTGEARRQLEKADRLIAEDLSDRNVAITMNFIEIDPGSMKIRYANAGMPFPLLFRAGQNQPEILKAAGVYIGSGYSRYPVRPEQVELNVEDGDLVVVFSDGIPEARDPNGRHFGQEGIIAAAARAGTECPETLADEVMRAVVRHMGKEQPDDDLTLVVVRIGEPSAKLRKARIQTLEEIASSQETLELSLMNAENAPHVLHEVLRPRLKAWAGDQGLDETRARKIWCATWEALQNAILYGSRRGDVLQIRLQRTPAGGAQIEIVQPRLWPDWDTQLEESKRHPIEPGGEPPLGGTVVMLDLSSSITGSNQGRRITMHFEC